MGSMFKTLRNAFRIEDLRKRILYTFFAMLIYRLGAAVPVPGISAVAFAELFGRFGQLGQFLQIISGTGGFRAVSIFSLGIQPYINASIIMQLLTVGIPYLERLSKEGEAGRKKIQRITRYVTIGIALFMSSMYWVYTRTAAASTMPMWINALVVITSFTAGSAFIMWLGEQINDKGIGNGISVLIFIGIVSRLPSMLQALYYSFLNWQAMRNSVLAILLTLLVIVVFVGIIALVVWIQSSERKVPVQYAKRVVGRKVYGGQASYLPIKVNQSGVLPVIFALQLIMMPSLLVNLFGATGKVAQWFNTFNENPLYYVLYALFIIGFTFFYSSINFNPHDIANNIQKNGGFIPGIRPGRPTIDYIKGTARRLSWFEAIFLVFIVLLPSLLSLITKTSTAIWFGGTGVLIVVGVAMDIVNQLEAQMMMRHYKGFLD
ncbi:MAG: preprotein translocase subunit SecY [Eubacteriales bacterium]|nr:preprotein translocase subunit SecY [Eubacteriales bacterium]